MKSLSRLGSKSWLPPKLREQSKKRAYTKIKSKHGLHFISFRYIDGVSRLYICRGQQRLDEGNIRHVLFFVGF